MRALERKESRRGPLCAGALSRELNDRLHEPIESFSTGLRRRGEGSNVSRDCLGASRSEEKSPSPSRRKVEFALSFLHSVLSHLLQPSLLSSSVRDNGAEGSQCSLQAAALFRLATTPRPGRRDLGALFLAIAVSMHLSSGRPNSSTDLFRAAILESGAPGTAPAFDYTSSFPAKTAPSGEFFCSKSCVSTTAQKKDRAKGLTLLCLHRRHQVQPNTYLGRLQRRPCRRSTRLPPQRHGSFHPRWTDESQVIWWIALCPYR